MAFIELFIQDDIVKTLLYVELPTYYSFSNN